MLRRLGEGECYSVGVGWKLSMGGEVVFLGFLWLKQRHGYGNGRGWVTAVYNGRSTATRRLSVILGFYLLSLDEMKREYNINCHVYPQ